MIPLNFLLVFVLISWWVFTEIRYPGLAWLRIFSGLCAMGLLVLFVASSLWANFEYVTGTHMYFLKAVQADLRGKPVEEVLKDLDDEIPKIAECKNSATAMHHLVVERDLAEIKARKDKKP